MAAEKKVNYTEAQIEAMIADYTAGKSVEDLAAAMGKAVRSVRAKLVQLKVYQKAEPVVKAAKEEGPTKKDLLNVLDGLLPKVIVDGLNNVKKETIQDLIDHLAVKE